MVAGINRKLPENYKVSTNEYQHEVRKTSLEDDEAEVPAVRKDPRKLSPSEEWFRVRSVLYFIDMLDKLMFYASRGSVFNVAEVSEVFSQKVFLSRRFLGTSLLRIKSAARRGFLEFLYQPWRFHF